MRTRLILAGILGVVDRWGRYDQIYKFDCIYIVNSTAIYTTFENVHQLHLGYTIIRVVAVGDGIARYRNLSVFT